MAVIQTLDDGIKEKTSLYFRAVLIIYSVVIVIHYKNSFSFFSILLMIAVYGGLFFILRKKIKYFRLLRLINDFAYITYIGYQVGYLNYDVAVFIMLPLVNALNHTHNSIRKSFSIQLYVLTLISFTVINRFKFDPFCLVPIIAVTLINLIMAFRMFLNKFNEKLDNIIEYFYLSNHSVFKVYKILRDIIDEINKDEFLRRWIKIKRISFFKVSKNRFPFIIISSDFVQSYIFDALPEKDDTYFIPEIKGQINDEIISNGVGLHLKNSSSSDFILIEFEKKVNNMFLSMLLEKILIPVVTRLLRINTLEYEISRLKKEHFQKTKEEFENIDAAANAIHFLANKLTPVTNYFKMVNDLNDNKIPKEHIQEWGELIDSDFRRASNNVKSIQMKMMQIAQYTSSSRIISEFTEFKIKSFVTYLRKVFYEDCIYPATITIAKLDEQLLENSIKVNMAALDFVFIELIDNYNKHSESDISIEMNIEIESRLLILNLTNKIKDFNDNKNEVLGFVNDFNTGEVNELLKRKGNKGIKFLKQFLQELNIDHSCKNDNVIMYIFLKFKMS